MRKTLFKKCAFERAFEKSLVVIMTLLLWCGVWITGTLLITSVFWYFGGGEFLDLLWTGGALSLTIMLPFVVVSTCGSKVRNVKTQNEY